MIEVDLKDLWTPTGLLLGFQATLFKWRIEREAHVGDKGVQTWLVPADYVGIASMIVLVFGVFLLPLSGIVGTCATDVALGLGALLFVGQSLGLCGHYEMFNRNTPRSFEWFPVQERVVIVATLLFAACYIVTAATCGPH